MHVIIDGREFVDKEEFKNNLLRLLNQDEKDALSQDERDGIQMAKQRIWNA